MDDLLHRVPSREITGNMEQPEEHQWHKGVGRRKQTCGVPEMKISLYPAGARHLDGFRFEWH